MNEESEHANKRRLEFLDKLSEHHDRLHPWVLKMTGNQADADDITQEALVRYIRHMDQKGWETKIENTGAYLRRIAHNLYVDLCKRRNHEVQFGYEDEETGHTNQEVERKAATTDDTVGRIEDASHFGKLLREMPKSLLHGFSDYERELLRLRKVDGLSAKEAAGILQKDVYRVRYDLNKIEARLRYRVRLLMYGKNGGDPEGGGAKASGADK
jgi:RNA polymerase sigma factor (sigma-70 family)